MLLALVAGTLAVMAGSASAAGWQPPVAAETGDRAAFATEVGVDGQGNAVGVWARHVSGLEWEIVASSRPRGGKWTTPTALSGDTRTEVLRPKVAVDPDGNAVAVWAARPPLTGNEETWRTLWSASRPPGGTWSEPAEISTASGVSSFDVVIDASGTATAIWSSLNEGEDDPPGSFTRTANLPLNGDWSDPAELSVSTGTSPQVAVNPDGDATAVWVSPDPDTGHFVVRSKSRPAGGSWGATATDLSSDAGDAAGVQVSVDPDGNAIAAWSYSEEDVSGDDDIVVQTAYRSATSATWSAPTLLWDDATNERLPEVALATDPQGNTTAVWSSFAPGGNVMRSSTRTAGDGGAWSSPVALSTPDGGSVQGKVTNPRIVADPQGGLTATWSAAVGPSPGIGVTENRRLQAVHRPAGGAWSSPVALSAPDDVWAAEIAADPQGYVTALWVGASGVTSRVFDSVAPLLEDVTVPVSGVVGQPVAMSVDPFDVWSSVTTGWDFGDGGSGSGATVSHCYGTPGEYTVGIAGTDGAANEASESQTISIEPDPSLEPGSDPCVPPEPPDESGSPGEPGNSNFSGSAGPIAGGSPPPAPIVSGLRQSHPRWRTAGARDRSPLPVGTTFRFRLDRASRVRLAFSPVVTGWPASARRGALEIAGKAGANAYRFDGSIRGRALAPGRYQLLVTALANGERSAVASLAFTIVG